MLGEGNLCLTEGNEKLLAQDLTGMRGNSVVGLHGYPL